MNLVKILEKNKKLHIHIVVVTLKMTSCKTMSKKEEVKTKILWTKQTIFENPALQPLGNFSHMAACRSSLENT
jgi:hypothetical protein